MAALARRAGGSLSVAADRVMMLQYAQDLEVETAALDAQAASLERTDPTT
jgi:hypothetical protein